ncbi:hypothetical protein ACQY0O_006588 [Thecaphora frezii]
MRLNLTFAGIYVAVALLLAGTATQPACAVSVPGIMDSIGRVSGGVYGTVGSLFGRGNARINRLANKRDKEALVLANAYSHALNVPTEAGVRGFKGGFAKNRFDSHMNGIKNFKPYKDLERIDFNENRVDPKARKLKASVLELEWMPSEQLNGKAKKRLRGKLERLEEKRNALSSRMLKEEDLKKRLDNMGVSKNQQQALDEYRRNTQIKLEQLEKRLGALKEKFPAVEPEQKGSARLFPWFNNRARGKERAQTTVPPQEGGPTEFAQSPSASPNVGSQQDRYT